MTKPSNHLVHSTSPYLLQHAHNPVDWYPWGKEALDKAREEDKPILVSIGYAACHWCHVMERECFENEQIASIMNAHFVCIKVDREERPDVDQIYMDAVQTMGINGGWPLNVFTMPDQKPFYGGTYFPPNNWVQVLQGIANAFKNDRAQLEESAREFGKALAISESEKYGLKSSKAQFDKNGLTEMFEKLKGHFDRKLGGLDRAPKFPNPSIWNFLLTGNVVLKDPEVENQIKRTLDAMANGGIYDHLGGGFARYSVDERWFAPHFEKMLYDNAQLVSMYSAAYRAYKTDRYREVVQETVAFLEREMMGGEGGFYSALDADSEGEEGTYYVWKADEIRSVLREEAGLFMDYFHVSEQGNWEAGKNILHKALDIRALLERWQLTQGELEARIADSRKSLFTHRQKRERPGLDDKVITAWNGLMLKALADAYLTFGDKKYLDLAVRSAKFITTKLNAGPKLCRTYKNGKAAGNGFLDDYAFVIQGLLALYEITFGEDWLVKAKELNDYSVENFFDKKEGLFFYTDQHAEALIARKKEVFDSVVPASNSAMAANLLFLGKLYDNEKYLEISREMLSKTVPLLKAEPQYLTNWGTLYVMNLLPVAEVAVLGKKAVELGLDFGRYFIPNKIMMGTETSSALPLLQGRTAINGQDTIYVCFDKTCKLPVHSVEEALEQIPV